MNFFDYAVATPKSKWEARVLSKAGRGSVRQTTDGKRGFLMVNFGVPDDQNSGGRSQCTDNRVGQPADH